MKSEQQKSIRWMVGARAGVGKGGDGEHVWGRNVSRAGKKGHVQGHARRGVRKDNKGGGRVRGLVLTLLKE